MNKRVSEAVTAAVAPHLSEGEQVELLSVAQLRQTSVTKSMAAGLAVAALTAGVLTVYSSPKKQYVVLTSRRLLIMDANSATGRPTGQIVLDLPRDALAVTDVRTRRVVLVVPMLSVELAVAGLDKGLRLVFPTVIRAEGRQLASALGGRTVS